MSPADCLLCWLYVIYFAYVECEPAIQFLKLSQSLPTHIYAGLGGIYQQKLYAIHSVTCATASVTSGSSTQCVVPPTAVGYTLDLSNIELSGTNNKTISFTNAPSWQQFTVTNFISAPSETSSGYRSSGSTFLGQYVYSVYPEGKYGVGSQAIMKYDMDTNAYIRSNTQDDYYALLSSDAFGIRDSCVTNNGTYVYSMGGYSSDSDLMDIVWQLDINNDVWTELNSLNIPRRRASCTVVGDKIYVLGGFDVHGVTGNIEEFSSNSWFDYTNTYSTALSVPRQLHTSYTHPNNKWIITLGGLVKTNDNIAMPIEIIDVVSELGGIHLQTDVIYRQKQYLSTIYHYNSDISIIFAYGGFVNGVYYDEVNYLVLHKDDYIASFSPTSFPSVDPTMDPTNDPSANPTSQPTQVPTSNPTKNPSSDPTTDPTYDPSIFPTLNPSTTPSNDPSVSPSFNPSNNPTVNPTLNPTIQPTYTPSSSPTEPGQTRHPTVDPSIPPTEDPSKLPTTNPSQNPSLIPTRNPAASVIASTEPTARPTTHEDQEVAAETTQISSTKSIISTKANETFQVGNSTMDVLNDSVTYAMIALISFCILFIIISYVSSTCIYKGCDPPNYFALFWVVMEVYDFFSDVSFSVYLWYLKDEESDLLYIFIAASIFIYCPYILNLIYLSHRINRWKTQLSASAIGEWLSYWDWWLICCAMLTGGSHPSVEICNSLLFPVDAFAMHLPWSEIVKIRTERFCTTVLFENVPQLVIQLYLLTSVEAVTGNSIIYLTILSSVGSIAFSSLYYFVNQQKEPKCGKNHWIFRMRLRSNDIAEHHRHSWFKMQVAVSKSLEIANKEWIRVTRVHHKANELRCDGFISIPDQKKEDIHMNTFDEEERNLFINRLEAAKEDKSNYHMSLVKQLEIEMKVKGMKVDFEIGQKNEREGAEYPAEGGVDEYDANNDTLDTIPGMPKYHHNGNEYDEVGQVEMHKIGIDGPRPVPPVNDVVTAGSPQDLRTDNGMIDQMLDAEFADLNDDEFIVEESEIKTPKGVGGDVADDLLNDIDAETIGIVLGGDDDDDDDDDNVLNEIENFQIDTIE